MRIIVMEPFYLSLFSVNIKPFTKITGASITNVYGEFGTAFYFEAN
jgi:hypothetical protein